MITTPYDSIAAEWGAARARLLPKEERYLSLALAPLTGSGVVLDLGCGTGHPMATHIATLGHRIVGVDGSSKMLAVAQARLPAHQWIHERIERVELDDVFDAVVCWDSLFHLPRTQWAGVISNVHRWLRPAGRLMLSSGGNVDPNGGGFTDTMFGHEFFYDSLPADELLDLLDVVGFDVIVHEMCDQPDGDRNKGKRATVAARR